MKYQIWKDVFCKPFLQVAEKNVGDCRALLQVVVPFRAEFALFYRSWLEY